MRLEDLILRSIAKRCVSKDEAIEVEIALAAGISLPALTGSRRECIGGFAMTRILRACLLGLALLMTAVSTTRAADRTILLRLGAGSALVLERPFETVLIENPDVVDVHTQGDRSVIVEALNLGASNLVFVDARSIAIANIRILVCNAGAIRAEYRDGPGCE